MLRCFGGRKCMIEMNSDEVRQPTGVPGCDEITGGGLMTGRSYLLVGTPGSGKTVLSLQWLRDGVRRSEEGTYISLCDPVEQIARDVTSFGWDLKGIAMVDLSPRGDDLDEHVGDYHMFPPSEVESVQSGVPSMPLCATSSRVAW